MGPYTLRIVNDGNKGVRVKDVTLHSGAWMGAWSLIVYYPGGTHQVINPYRMGTSIPIEEWMTGLSPGQSLRIQVNNGSPLATKFRAAIDIR